VTRTRVIARDVSLEKLTSRFASSTARKPLRGRADGGDGEKRRDRGEWNQKPESHLFSS